MKIKKIWSLAVSTSIAVALTACSGNPVDEKNVALKATASTNKTTNSVASKEPKKKAIVVASKAPKKKAITVAKKVPTKKVTVTKQLTRAQVRAKKQSIASLGKTKQVQARLNNTKAQLEKKRLETIRLRKIKAERSKVSARNAVQVANASNTNWLGRDRFVGSQANQPTNVRSSQPVKVRAKQPVQTRSRQPVRTRSIQPVRTRAKQPIRSRVQVARANPRRPAVKRPNPRLRKVAYKRPTKRPAIARIDPNNSFGYALSNAAIERTKQRVRYDGKYVKIGYPWGDVPKSIGVCTDVVIRAYRKLGVDLQQEVHKDISQDFYAYPNLVKWGLKKPDTNIDHRRVYNLQVFFKRHNAELPRSKNPRDYKAGDLVTWMVGPNFPHIGVVVNKPSKADSNRLMIAHNIGYGPQVEDILFRFPMTGHYRYTKKHRSVKPALLYAKSRAPASASRQLSYAEMLQASNILAGNVKAKRRPNVSDLLVKNNKNTKSKERIMLAQLDARIFNIHQNTLKRLK